MERSGWAKSITLVVSMLLSSAVSATTFTGTVSPGNEVDYTVPTNAGDNLVISVTPTNPTNARTDILLFDPSNNLVAIASGNLGDFVSSEIDWTALQSGTMLVEVFGISDVPYQYSLSILGNTGGIPARVPEPATLALLGVGLSSLALTRRRRLH